MIRTAGIFLIRKDQKILICHPTKHKDTVWSIPKGRMEEGEDVVETAVRETYEETNVDVSEWSVIHKLEPAPYPKSNKVLFGIALFESENKFSFNFFDLKCNSNVPLEAGGFPEMDGYQWATIDDAEKLVHAAQINCLNQIRELINSMKIKE